MTHRWNDDDALAAVGSRCGRAAVLERPAELPDDGELEPQPLAPHEEHHKETVVAFPGLHGLDEGSESLLDGVLMEFLEEAPRRGYRTVVLSCDEEAPFRPLLEKAVERAALNEELRQVRFTTDPRRIDLFAVFQRAMGQGRGVANGLAERLLQQRAAGVLVVAPDNEAGQLFFWALSGFLEGEHSDATAEFVQEPPEPGADLRVASRMFALLSRQSPA
jgi:hypothetical protein